MEKNLDIYKIPSNTYTVHGNTKKELTLDEKDILTKSIELINENNKISWSIFI